MICVKSGIMLLDTSFRTFYLSTVRNNEMADVQISEVGRQQSLSIHGTEIMNDVRKLGYI